MTRSKCAVVALILALAAATQPARGQLFDGASAGAAAGNIDGFTVAGKGAAAAKPNRLEIDLEVSAASELSSDAIVKYRDAKKRLQEAFAALKLKNVAVEERGLNVEQKGQMFNPYYMDTPPARKGKIEVQLSRKLIVTCNGIRDMDEEAVLQLVAKLLDVAQDAGGKIGGQNDNMPYYYYRYNQGGSGLVRFILDDFSALEEKAYGEAIAEARSKAGRLAKLSGVELGRVVGVREVVVPGEKLNSFNPYGYGASSNDDEMPRKRLESSKFQEIPVRVELQVRFVTAGAPKDKGREGGQ
jgi:uncharacterized protein